MQALIVSPSSPALRPFIESLWYVAAELPHARERILPAGGMQLLVNLYEDELRTYHGEEFARLERIRGAALSGAFARPFGIDTAEQRRIVGVGFAPGGAAPFFAMPSDALSDAHVELDALWGRDGTLLRERLLEAPGPEAALRSLEDALLARVVRPLEVDKLVEFAVAALDRGVPVGQLVAAGSRAEALHPPLSRSRGTDAEAVRPRAALRARAPVDRAGTPGRLEPGGGLLRLLRPGPSDPRFPRVLGDESDALPAARAGRPLPRGRRLTIFSNRVASPRGMIGGIQRGGAGLHGPRHPCHRLRRAPRMIQRVRASNEWNFVGVLPQADRALAIAWWTVLVLRGLLPAGFTVAMGALVGAVERAEELAAPLALMGVVFVLMQVLSPIHQALGANLGSRTAAWLYDQLATACVGPPGMGHLENPELTNDLNMARDFDLGISGPPMSISMDFIASELVEMVGGLASALVLAFYAWWAPLVLGGAWLATHWLLRESGVWRDRETPEVREAQRHAEYAYRLAVDPPAAKELRLFGLAGWTIERFRSQRRRLFELRWQATRLRERPVLWSLLLVLAANLVVFGSLGAAAAEGHLALDRLVTFASAAVGTSMIAFGGLSWALDGASAPAAAVLRLESAMDPAGALVRGERSAAGMPAREIRFRDVTFAYPTTHQPVLAAFDLAIPAGSSLAIVGLNGAGKTTLAKLLCRLYDPQGGTIEVDGVDLRALDLESWRARVAAVFQDFIRFELPLRDNVAPAGAPDEVIRAALAEAGAANLADLDQVLARGYPGGTDLSGGQWQRVALARALCSVQLGASLVLLDEPTAQLDVRGEAEIFERILAATRHATTILISHRFSTVRHADRICVLEHGKVVELGTHDELMAAGGRYRTMFELQASRFGEDGEEGAALDVLD